MNAVHPHDRRLLRAVRERHAAPRRHGRPELLRSRARTTTTRSPTCAPARRSCATCSRRSPSRRTGSTACSSRRTTSGAAGSTTSPPPHFPDDRANADDLLDFSQAGFRVPTVLASPFARPGHGRRPHLRPHVDPALPRVALPRRAARGPGQRHRHLVPDPAGPLRLEHRREPLAACRSTWTCTSTSTCRSARRRPRARATPARSRRWRARCWSRTTRRSTRRLLARVPRPRALPGQLLTRHDRRASLPAGRRRRCSDRSDCVTDRWSDPVTVPPDEHHLLTVRTDDVELVHDEVVVRERTHLRQVHAFEFSISASGRMPPFIMAFWILKNGERDAEDRRCRSRAHRRAWAPS